MDYVPKGLKFYKEDNKGWKDEGNNVISTKLLKDTLLHPGQSTTVKVILRWINGENNLGLKKNVAKISEDYNEKGVPDRDSTPDNKKKGEDDIEDAPVLLTISTGMLEHTIQYATIVVVILTILGAGLVVIKKYHFIGGKHMRRGYSKVLTVILIIIIIAVVGLLAYLGYDYYSRYRTNKDGEAYVNSLTDGIAVVDSNTNTTATVPDDIPSTDYNTLTDVSTDSTTTTSSESSTKKRQTYKGFYTLGPIEIPKTGVKYPILERVTKRLLKLQLQLYGQKM